jgi:hypothetical protein
MIEHPLLPKHPVKERAIIDSESFLMHSGNQAFLSGTRPRPVFGTLDGKILLGIALWGLIVVGAILLSIALLPLVADSLWLAQVVLPMVCLSPFVALGWGFWWLNRRYHQPMAGQVIQGEVIESEKIRTTTTKGRKIDTLWVQYQFTDPSGMVVTGESRTSPVTASRDMAPAPHTSVYIWYTPQGKHYLL